MNFIKMKMNVNTSVKCVCAFLLSFHSVMCTNTTSSDCILTLKSGFGVPSPVIMHAGDFVAPGYTGDVQVPQSEALIVACPGDRRQLVFGNESQRFSVAEARCVGDNIFQIGRWMGPFSDIHCNQGPWFHAEETNRECYGKKKIYKIGYHVSGKFHLIYKACFDKEKLTTLYTMHQLSPSSFFVQGGKNRPPFIEGDLFHKVPMDALYKKQKDRLNHLLGADMDHQYITKKQYITRGHLAPRADFPLLAIQRASFHYINTAPQWMRGNAGDWAALEEGLRRRIYAYNSSVIVYTGTYGVSTLESRGGRPVELYLGADVNNNNVVPVPLYFFKLVHDPRKKTAVAFVLINSSYYNQSMVKSLTFCVDICYGNPDYTWLKRRKDGTHSFCCEYDEFVEKIDTLPSLEINGVFA